MEGALDVLPGGAGRALMAASAKRVAGVGPALFALIFIGSFCMLLVVIGVRSPIPIAFIAPAIVIFGVAAAIIFTAPRGTVKSDYGTSTQLVAAGSVLTVMGLFSLLALVMLMIHSCITKVEARALNYRRDVLKPI